MDAEKFLKILDKEIPNLILLVGEEHFYTDKIVGKVKNKWFSGGDEGDITVFASEPSLAEFLDVVSGNSFFSQKTLVIIEQSRMLASGKMNDKERDGFIKIFSEVPEHCCIIIKCDKPDKRLKNYKLLTGITDAVSCEKIKSYKVKDFLIKEASTRGCHWNNDALALITEYMSTLEDISLYFIYQELEIKVKEGAAVKRGEVVLILEAMKMQNEIMSPVDGTVKSINTSAGASVASGDVMIVVG